MLKSVKSLASSRTLRLWSAVLDGCANTLLQQSIFSPTHTPLTGAPPPNPAMIKPFKYEPGSKAALIGAKYLKLYLIKSINI